MSESENSKQFLRTKARQNFFIAVDEAAFFSKLDDAINRSKLLLKDTASTFRRNLESVILTITVPFQLTSSSAQRLRFQQLYIAEKIRAGSLINGGMTEAEAYDEAYAIAQDRFSEELANPENINLLSQQVLESLEQSLNSEGFSRASSELLRQGVVSLWGAFEILVQDLLVTLLNAQPSLAVELLTHDQTRALFQLKALPLDTLASHNFDVSKSLGDILVRHRSVDSIPIMKAVLRVLLPQSGKLKDMFDHKELWILNQCRHLFVHRRGIVDSAYLSKTGETLSLGAELVISPDDLEQHLIAVMDAGVELINEMSHYH